MQRQNSKTVMNKTIFDFLFESSTKMITNLTTMKPSPTTTIQTTTTMMPTTSISTTTTTTKPITIFEDSEEITESIETTNSFLLVIVILLTTIVLYKIIKLCKTGYNMHNEKIIRVHERTNPQL